METDDYYGAGHSGENCDDVQMGGVIGTAAGQAQVQDQEARQGLPLFPSTSLPSLSDEGLEQGPGQRLVGQGHDDGSKKWASDEDESGEGGGDEDGDCFGGTADLLSFVQQQDIIAYGDYKYKLVS